MLVRVVGAVRDPTPIYRTPPPPAYQWRGRAGCAPGRPVAPEVTKFLQLKLRNEDGRSSVPIVRTAGRHWPAAVRNPSEGRGRLPERALPWFEILCK